MYINIFQLIKKFFIIVKHNIMKIFANYWKFWYIESIISKASIV